MFSDLPSRLSEVFLQTPARKTATFQGPWTDVGAYEGTVKVLLHAALVSGTTPTLDWSIEHASDGAGAGSGTYLSSANFTQITSGTSLQSAKIDSRNCKGYIRVVGTLGGTSPNFDVTASFVGMKKYNI
jgi:hypothetical protein